MMVAVGIDRTLPPERSGRPTRRDQARPGSSGHPPAAPAVSGTRTAECRSCGGLYTTGPADARGRPFGWLSVSVSVPCELSRTGKPYQWIGTYCCARCLADGTADIRQAEAIARKLYQADPPQRRPVRGDIARLMAERPNGR